MVAPGGGGNEARGASQNRRQAEQRFADHRAVADGAGLGLVVKLLGGGAGGDQRVEAGGRPAGNDDEDEGVHRRCTGWMGVHHRRHEFGAEDEESDIGEPEPEIEQERVEEVAGLQQRPHREHRGQPGVEEEHPRPAAHRRPAQREMGRQSHDHKGEDEGRRDQNPKRAAAAADQPSDDEGEDQDGARGDDRLGVVVGGEEKSDDVGEDAHCESYGEEDDGVHQRFRAPAHEALGDGAD